MKKRGKSYAKEETSTFIIYSGIYRTSSNYDRSRLCLLKQGSMENTVTRGILIFLYIEVSTLGKGIK